MEYIFSSTKNKTETTMTAVVSFREMKKEEISVGGSLPCVPKTSVLRGGENLYGFSSRKQGHVVIQRPYNQDELWNLLEGAGPHIISIKEGVEHADVFEKGVFKCARNGWVTYQYKDGRFPAIPKDGITKSVHAFIVDKFGFVILHLAWKEGEKDEIGVLSVAGGTAEIGESIIVTLTREVQEEHEKKIKTELKVLVDHIEFSDDLDEDNPYNRELLPDHHHMMICEYDGEYDSKEFVEGKRIEKAFREPIDTFRNAEKTSETYARILRGLGNPNLERVEIWSTWLPLMNEYFKLKDEECNIVV